MYLHMIYMYEFIVPCLFLYMANLVLKALFHFEILVGTHDVALNYFPTSILWLWWDIFVYAELSVTYQGYRDSQVPGFALRAGCRSPGTKSTPIQPDRAVPQSSPGNATYDLVKNSTQCLFLEDPFQQPKFILVIIS